MCVRVRDKVHKKKVIEVRWKVKAINEYCKENKTPTSHTIYLNKIMIKSILN